MTENMIAEIDSVVEFLTDGTPILDVRSPSEFAQGHIPGAINVPILCDEHRAIVGTVYKTGGREAAILKGFELVGEKLHGLIKQAIKHADKKNIFVHCARGGMRSNFFATFMAQAGLSPSVLVGGYKAYRKTVLERFKEHLHLQVVTGKTGSGKTLLLQQLRELGEQVLDLEGLANHRGSSFGGISQGPQPTVEQFENRIIAQIDSFAPDRPVWVEDESRRIGRVHIPNAFWDLMQQSTAILVSIPFEHRLDFIMQDYGDLPKEDLISATERIEKRLGPQNKQRAIELLNADKIRDAFAILLEYYDKAYTHSAEKSVRRNTIRFDAHTSTPVERWTPDQFKALIEFSKDAGTAHSGR